MRSLPFLLCGCLTQEDDHHQDTWWPRSGGRNPYSSRGLDKFAAVLAELEAKKKRIVAQLGSKHGEAWVRFVQSNSNDWVPIVVKVKRSKDKKKAKLPLPHTAQVSGEKHPEKKLVAAGIGRKALKKSFSWNTKQGGGSRLWLRWRAGYYWPVVFVLILVCVVLFGRSFAIVCTSIWWYMVPSLKGNGANMRKSLKKRYVNKISGNKLGGDHLIIRSTPQRRKLGTSKASTDHPHMLKTSPSQCK